MNQKITDKQAENDTVGVNRRGRTFDINKKDFDVSELVINKKLMALGIAKIRCATKPKPITMPNGQVGFTCLKCNDFYPHVEANNSDGFMCRKCR